jgi:hypothetical protein
MSEPLNLQVFTAELNAEDDLYVPGQDLPAPSHAPSEHDAQNIADQLIELASRESSALAKSRALSIASLLRSSNGDVEASVQLAHSAAATSPRLTLCTEIFDRQAREAGPAVYESRAEELGWCWENSGRQAQDVALRQYAHHRQLAQLEQQGQHDQAQALLERLVRSGEGGVGLELKRIAQRLAQGQSLSGITPPKAFADDVQLATEIVTHRPSALSNAELVRCGDAGRDLLIQRAAHELQKGHAIEAIEALEQAGLPGHLVVEFAAAVHGAAPGGFAERIRLLWKLARADNGRRVLRSLLTTAVLAADRATIANALQQADQGAGILELKERLLLLAFAGQQWTSSRQDLVELHAHDPVTAMALASPLEPAVVPQHTSVDALLIQLAAALIKSQPEQASPPEAASIRSEAPLPSAEERLNTALLELELRGEAALLCAAVRLQTEGNSDDPSERVDALCRLSSAANSEYAQLIRGSLLESIARTNDAQQLYADLLGSPDAALSLSALRALLALDPGASHGDRSLLWGGAQNHELALWTHLECALCETTEQGATRTAFQAVSGAYQAAQTTDERHPFAAPLFAATLACEGLHIQSEAEEGKRLLMQDDFLPSQLSRMKSLWDETSRPSAAECEVLHASRDAGLRALGNWLLPPSSEAEPARERSSVELQLDFVRSSLSADSSTARQALELAQAAGPPNALLSEVLLDASELELTLHPETANALVSSHFGQLAGSADSPADRRFFLERLVELDERTQDNNNALLLRKALAEEFPDDIATQLHLEELQHRLGQAAHSSAQRLADVLPAADRAPYRLHLGISALVQSDLRAARKFLEPLLDEPAPPLACVRALITIAREKRDEALLDRCYQNLLGRELSATDSILVRYELSLVSERRGERSLARGYLAQALKLAPTSFPLRHLEHYLSEGEQPIERAERLSLFAQACSLDSNKIPLLRAAADTFKAAQDFGRAVICYQELLALQPDDRASFENLVEIHQQRDDTTALRAVYTRRLAYLPRKSGEQRELLLDLSRLLASLEAWQEAQSQLEILLADHPGCLDALRAHARISLKLEDYDSAERSFVALFEQLADGDERLQAAHQLGGIYFEHTQQLEKAMNTYQWVLEASPADLDVSTRLVDIYCRLGLAERAAQLQVQLIQAAELAETKRSLALRLAEIYETVGRDKEKALSTLESTRKAWPLDAAVLSASISFLDRVGDTSARGMTLSRAEKDTRRKLDEGTLDPALLETLATIARLNGQPGEAQACSAARSAYLGSDDGQIKPAGLHALSPRIDVDLAPRTYPDPLRRLLEKTGDAMDAAFSVDLHALGAQPLTSGQLHDRVQKIAETIGWPRIELFQSDTLGVRCLPVSRRPPRLVVGPGLEHLSHRARDYQLLRAFKLQIMGVGALSRSREEDRHAAVVALLMLFAPQWRPTQVDARKVARARALLEQGLGRVGYDDEVPTLALEAIGALGGVQDGFMDAPRVLASRACLIGVGDLSAVFEAMAAGEGKRLPESGPARFRFIESFKEARELLLFMTTAKFTRARTMLGLVEEARPSGAELTATSLAPMAPRRPPRPPTKP